MPCQGTALQDRCRTSRPERPSQDSIGTSALHQYRDYPGARTPHSRPPDPLLGRRGILRSQAQAPLPCSGHHPLASRAPVYLHHQSFVKDQPPSVPRRVPTSRLLTIHAAPKISVGAFRRDAPGAGWRGGVRGRRQVLGGKFFTPEYVTVFPNRGTCSQCRPLLMYIIYKYIDKQSGSTVLLVRVRWSVGVGVSPSWRPLSYCLAVVRRLIYPDMVDFEVARILWIGLKHA